MSCNCSSCSSSCGTNIWNTICTSLTNIGSWLSTISGNIVNGFNGIQNINTPVYTTETRARQNGVANRQTVGAGSSIQLGTSWRWVTIRHPVANTEDATISIGGNTITMSPGDNDLVFDFTAERFATPPALTITPDAAETGDLEVDHVYWPNV